jgi:hypothetical protein
MGGVAGCENLESQVGFERRSVGAKNGADVAPVMSRKRAC